MRSFRIWLICVISMAIAFYYGFQFGMIYRPMCDVNRETEKPLCTLLALFE